MTEHLHRDIDNVLKEILAMGSMVEEATNKAINALVNRSSETGREVIAADPAIDAKENAIEEDCLRILALHQPVAVDLRFVVTCLKVNNDLERVGDLAVNIAERAVQLGESPPLRFPSDLSRMADKVRAMLRDSLDALVRRDVKLAEQVLVRDQDVDRDHRHIFDVVQERMSREPSTVRPAISTLSSSRYLERIADHATNIAEDVIFMIEGRIVRHRPETI